MGYKLSSKKTIEDMELPESGRSFFSVDVPKTGRAMLEQGKRVHSYTLKGRRFRCEDPLKIHFIANNEDVVGFLRDHERLDLSHYDDSLKSGGDGATFFITGEKDTLETQWKIFSAALKMRPEIQRFIEEGREGEDYYDLIQEQAEMAIQEAIVEIYKRRDNPSLLTHIRTFFGKQHDNKEVDIIREYGLVVSHIFVRDFLGLRIPGRTVYRQTQKFYLWIAIMFANLFVNPGGRNTILNVISSVVSRMYRRQILKSYRNPKQGSVLHRLKILGEQDDAEEKYGAEGKPFEDYVVNIIMEVAGSFQYLTGSSFGNIIKSIDEKEEEGLGWNQIPKLVQKVSKNPRAWIDEYLRHNSPTGFIFRKAKKGFVIDDTDVLPGDLLCLITSEAAKDATVFGPKDALLDPEVSLSLCPRHTHFGSPDTDPNNGRPHEPHHPCFGQYWGRTILQTMIEGLLYFHWLQAAEGASFDMKMKIFPSYKMIFAKEKKTQRFITILAEIPKEGGNPEAAESILDNLGHQSGDAYQSLGLSHLVHFMSGHVIRGGETLPAKLPFGLKLPFIPKREPDYLILEISIDGDIDEFLRYASPVFYDWVADLYRETGITADKLPRIEMQKQLFDDHVTLQQSIWPSLFAGKSTNGLPFSGTIGLNRHRIKGEDFIAKKVEGLVEKEGHEKKTFHGRLHTIRKSLRKELIQSGRHPNNYTWVLGGSEPPHFSETRDDSWVENGDKKNLGAFDYLQLAGKLLPRVLLIPIIVLFGFLASAFYETPSGVVKQNGLLEFSSAKSFAFLMAAVFAAGIIGMIGRRFRKGVNRELGEMFFISAFYLGFLIFANSWAVTGTEVEFKLWEYPGLGPIPSGMTFPLTIGISGLVVSFAYYLKLKFSQSDYYVASNPRSKAVGVLIIWLLIGTSLYLHLFWMFPGELMSSSKMMANSDYLVANRFISGELREHLFYPTIHASVIVLTIHAYRKSFYNPSIPLMNSLNVWLFLGFAGLIWFCALFPIKTTSYVFVLLRDISVYTFFLPILIATFLLAVFRLLNPAIATKGSKHSNFIREILGWAVIISILMNLNSSIRDFWGGLFNIEPWTGKEIDSYIPQLLAITKAFVLAFPITLVMTLIIALMLQKLTLAVSEQSNTPHDSDPGIANMRNMMSRENAEDTVQNHMISVQRLLPEWFRIRVLLPLSFHIIRRMLTTGIIRPGFLGNVGTVHFARWIHLPRTRNYAFISNYDGSFESYLEDFVTKVNSGLNAAWSHCVGFPKVKNIFVDGTRDGDRFKRWARGSTRPTPFWYSAYPELTVEVIRRNALIRDGLVRARSASEAEAWFDLFNSTTRPEHALQTDQIQSFAFGGAAHLKSGCCLIIQSETADPEFRTFLKRIINKVTFGQSRPKEQAVYFAVSNKGVRNLLNIAEVRERKPWQGDQSLEKIEEVEPTWFAAPYILGVDNEERARVLGDLDGNHRSHWEWGAYEKHKLHEFGVLLIYAANDELLENIVEGLEADAQGTKLTFHPISFKTHFDETEQDKNPSTRSKAKTETDSNVADINQSTDKHDGLVREPFGFVDGVSNPVIKGTARAAKNPNSIHLVNPGEFILGYRDNRGYFPPSPQVNASDDIHRMLPALPNQQPQKYPKFGERDSDSLRDLGRNGSYLVVRQLEQSVEKFDEITEKFAEDILKRLDKKTPEKILADESNISTMKSIVQAKMMGRWQDGQSLVTRPVYVNEFYNGLELPDPSSALNKITKKFLNEDNEYLFGRDDPQGYACPFGSHVRRANPRDSLDPNSSKELEVSNRHRLLRRGRSYVNKTTGAQGTFFMCLNTDIERQFEFVQQSWINGRNFHGLRNEYDPMSTKTGDFTIQCPGANFPLEIDNFVTVKGGGYFFLPSKDAILYFMKDEVNAEPLVYFDLSNIARATK